MPLRAESPEAAVDALASEFSRSSRTSPAVAGDYAVPALPLGDVLVGYDDMAMFWMVLIDLAMTPPSLTLPRPTFA